MRVPFMPGRLPRYRVLYDCLRRLDTGFTPATVIYAHDPVAAGRACRLAMAWNPLGEWHRQWISAAWVEAKLAETKERYANAGVTDGVPTITDEEVLCCQMDTSWLSCKPLFREEGVLVGDTWAYDTLVRNVGWVFAWKGTFIVVPKMQMSVDEHGFLHNTTGPALGTSVYALHGEILPRDVHWIIQSPEQLTPALIDELEDNDVRLSVIAAWPERYLTEPPDHSDEVGDLYIIYEPIRVGAMRPSLFDPWPREGDARFRWVARPAMGLVRVEDATTGEVHWIRVHPDIKTAREGVASSFGMHPEEYAPRRET